MGTRNPRPRHSLGRPPPPRRDTNAAPNPLCRHSSPTSGGVGCTRGCNIPAPEPSHPSKACKKFPQTSIAGRLAHCMEPIPHKRNICLLPLGADATPHQRRTEAFAKLRPVLWSTLPRGTTAPPPLCTGAPSRPTRGRSDRGNRTRIVRGGRHAYASQLVRALS